MCSQDAPGRGPKRTPRSVPSVEDAIAQGAMAVWMQEGIQHDDEREGEPA